MTAIIESAVDDLTATLINMQDSVVACALTGL
jgi:hypothetical protein